MVHRAPACRAKALAITVAAVPQQVACAVQLSHFPGVIMPPSSTLRVPKDCPLAAALAGRLRAASRDLVQQWLDRITERVAITPEHVFPSDELLDHMPMLVEGIADYIENPADEVSTDDPVVGNAMKLGALRHSQGFDAHEILKEYEILGGILFNYLAAAADEMPEPCEKSELLVCGHRLFRAVTIIEQSTTMHYLQLAEEKVAEREDRLRAFNRTFSHEIRNRIGAMLGASEVLGELGDVDEQRAKLQAIIARNAHAMKRTVDNLVALARTDTDARQHRNVRLPQAAAEAARQVREAAQAAHVDIKLSDNLPDVDVNAAVVELCLANYLSNAIKYRDPGADRSTVVVDAAIEGVGLKKEIVIRARDEGIGVPPEKREKLFQRFFRAHETVSEADGTGLGLSIVRDTVESIGGRAWAEFPERGSVFAFSIPFRRDLSMDNPGGPMRQGRRAVDAERANVR
jgi:signal transduction histidine kinase